MKFITGMIGISFILLWCFMHVNGFSENTKKVSNEQMAQNIHIVLIGASIGANWKIDELHKRTSDINYRLEYIGTDGFDKSKELEDVLGRSKKPDVIILKECAAYFPGDFNLYQRLVESWVQQCNRNRVIPVLATVVPVREPSIWQIQYWKNVVKKALYPERTTVQQRFDGLCKFNDWVRDYAKINHITVLDLEKALRVSDQDRHLKAEYDAGDGLHINVKAYKLLDQVLNSTLNNIDWKKRQRFRS